MDIYFKFTISLSTWKLSHQYLVNKSMSQKAN